MRLSSVAGVSPGVLRFIEDTADVVARGHDEQRTTREIETLLRAALADDFTLPDAYRTPRADRYVMYPVYVAPDASFSVASAVWNVGQQTPIHDHGVWGVVGILDGIEDEETFLRTTSGTLDNIGRELLSPGEVTICCTSDQDLHRVSAHGSTPCVGIHVYGGDIGTIRRRSYQLDGDIGYFVSAWPDLPAAVVED